MAPSYTGGGGCLEWLVDADMPVNEFNGPCLEACEPMRLISVLVVLHGYAKHWFGSKGPPCTKAPFERVASGRSFFQMLRIPITFDRDFGRSAVNVPQVVWREFSRDGPDVLIQARQLGRARYRNDPRFLRE